MPNYLKAVKLQKLAKEVLSTVAEYKNRGQYSEKHLELVLLALLRRHFTTVDTQVVSALPAAVGSKKQNQIDFRVGTTNRVVLEFAVRTKKHGNEHHVSQNKPELRKLTHERVAKVRYLLILDVSGQAHMAKATLEKKYKGHTSARTFKRIKGITVVYGYIQGSVPKTYTVKC
jgi:hypothetical protein